MLPAWNALRAPASLELESFDGAHRWNGVRAYPLLAKILKP
jgi:hypothetical protein